MKVTHQPPVGLTSRKLCRDADPDIRGIAPMRGRFEDREVQGDIQRLTNYERHHAMKALGKRSDPQQSTVTPKMMKPFAGRLRRIDAIRKESVG